MMNLIWKKKLSAGRKIETIDKSHIMLNFDVSEHFVSLRDETFFLIQKFAFHSVHERDAVRMFETPALDGEKCSISVKCFDLLCFRIES